MDSQRLARIFGILFLITFVTSIAALALFQSVLDDPAGYIAGGGKDNQIYLGALLEFFLILANVGTAVVLYPIVRRQNELLAVGYVAARIIESVFIAGRDHLCARRRDPCARTPPRPSADLAVFPSRRSRTGRSCSAPASSSPLGNGLILGYLMYSSGLVPRRMAWLGLVGGPLLLIGNVGVLFDAWDQTGAVNVLVVPEFLWELSLGIYATVWGFRRCRIVDEYDSEVPVRETHEVAPAY